MRVAMDAVSFSRRAYPIALALVAAVALALPIVRLWRRTGVWAITGLRTPEVVERALQLVLTVWALGLGAWGWAYATYGPGPLAVLELPEWVTWSGWAVAGLGLAVVVAAQAQMGGSWRIGIDAEATTLVTVGLFRLVRNPIYSGMCLVTIGLLSVSPSPWLGALDLTALIALLIQTRREEAHLRRLHGRAFEDWAARVGRFVPGVGRLDRR